MRNSEARLIVLTSSSIRFPMRFSWTSFRKAVAHIARPQNYPGPQAKDFHHLVPTMIVQEPGISDAMSASRKYAVETDGLTRRFGNRSRRSRQPDSQKRVVWVPRPA